MAGGDGADDGGRARLQRQQQRPAAIDIRALNAGEVAQLGRTRLRVTRLGLGTAPLGGLFEAVDDEDAHRVVEAAWDAGIRFFDTAPLYGHGLAERRLGAVLGTKPRDEFVLSTKVGRLLRATAAPGKDSMFRGTPPVDPVFDFSYDATMRSVEESLERLGLDRVDVLLIHDPDDHHDQALAGAYRALERLRSEGTVTAIGAGMNQSEMLARFAREADFDCFLLAGRYTLLDRDGAEELLPLCLERGIAVVAGGVFNSGVLAEPGPGAHFNYAPAAPQVVKEASRLKDICDRHGVDIKAAALQFPLRHPGITAVLTGCRSVAEVVENTRLFAMPVADAVWADLES